MLRRGSCVYLHVHRFYLVGLSGYVFHVMIMGFTSGFLGVSQWEAQRQLVCDVCVRTISCFVCTFLQSVCSCPSCTLAYFQSFFCKGVVFLSWCVGFCLCHKLSLFECVCGESAAAVFILLHYLARCSGRWLAVKGLVNVCVCAPNFCECACLHSCLWMERLHLHNYGNLNLSLFRAQVCSTCCGML